MANTWFRIPTVDALVKTHRGSRPGSPIADMIWHILMLRLHEEGEQALSRHPQVVQAFANFGIPITAVTWADDIVVPIATEHAVELLPCTTVILQDILSAFRARGLRLNLKRGKTTAVPTFCGDNAPKLRQEYLLQEDPAIEIQGDTDACLKLPLACSYRHLGAVYVPEATSDYEINTRIGIAAAAFQDEAANLCKQGPAGNHQGPYVGNFGLYQTFLWATSLAQSLRKDLLQIGDFYYVSC